MINWLDSYKSIFLDISFRDFWTVNSLIRNEDELPSRKILSDNLIQFWSNRNHSPNHFYLPVLCVRTGFDLFLRAKNYPVGSEILMSAVNIPSMILIARYHQLKVVPCDIDLETFNMNLTQVRREINEKTVAIVYAHIYGRCVDLTNLLDLVEEKNLDFIEDCAESFAGFCSCAKDSSNIEMFCPSRRSNVEPTCYLGHPRSHLVLFSFGVLKFCTALAGGFAKISDRNLYEQMSKIYANDPVQDKEQYRLNVKKYFSFYWILNVPHVIKICMQFVRLFRLNHMEYVVRQLRAFNKSPTADELFLSLRRQPCRALLAFLHQRFENYQTEYLQIQRENANYVLDRLVRRSSIRIVGLQSTVRNFWLFPLVVSKADLFVELLSKFHIDAYRGSTQLNVITKLLVDTDPKPEPLVDDDRTHRCPNAEYLIENVIYLPVHCHVPKYVLDQLIDVVNRISEQLDAYSLRSKL